MSASLRHVLLPPAVLLTLAAAIWLSGVNRALFLLLNHWAARLPDAFWAYTTLWGDTLLLTACVVPFAKRHPQLLWSVLIAALLGGLLVQALKIGFDAPRPPAVLAADQFHLIGRSLKRHSFPSGHSFTAFTFAVILIRQLRPRLAMRAWLLFGAAAVAFSRIAVGVHWPVDVLTGSALGWLTGHVAIGLAQRYRWGLSPGGRRFLLGFFILLAIALAFEKTDFQSAHWLLDLVAFCAIVLGAVQLGESLLAGKKRMV